MGRVIGVVGPSGVGKDTVIAALMQQETRLAKWRRVITRPETSGGEDFEGVSAQEFAHRAGGGEFILIWQAHGLSYGLPKDQRPTHKDVLVNLSRAQLADASAVFGSDFVVLSLTARPEVLADRLGQRGRETASDIAARLARIAPIPPSIDCIAIENEGPIKETVSTILAALYPANGQRVFS